jgi:cyclic beta-1,2-glucan glucanotransferase
VTVVADAAAPESVAKIAALRADARALAEVQKDLARAARLVTLFYEPPPVARPLERARRHLGAISSGDAPHPKAAEWFLDNYYLIRRVARQVEEELPRGFVRHLPRLASGPSKGRPRVDALARALVAKSGMVLDLAVLRRFVEAYQQVSPLTIAELWALPTMLRATVLKHLLRFLNELHVPVQGNDLKIFHLFADHDEEPEAISLDPGVGVERSIRTLRVLDSIDWKAFFAKTNRVEAILRTDPASVYARMDFETCDSYRKVVEALAWATGRAEEEVANVAIELASNAASDARRGHVGYYLVAGGRRLLQERVGYRPIGLDRVRRAVRSWPTVSYLLPLALLTLGPVLALSWYIAANVGRGDGRLVSIAVAAIVAVVPASAVAVAILRSLFARLLPPCTLPKLDFEKGLPSETRTLVVIPTLLGRAEDVAAMTRQIELHYLSNPDPELQFALLTDWVDAKTPQEISEKSSLLESVSQKIVALNAKHGTDGHGPFHLLHRHPRWNPAEERFMGWERKRGKLEELNRLLRGDTTTSFSLHVGNPEGLLGIRFVITLDSDTELPMGSAHRLVGLLAHPLNRAVFEADTGRVIAGYTIAQPRVDTSPSSSRRTLFSRILAGDVGFDIYTHASSELYQDLFGAGIYVGKGIYDVDALMKSVEGRVPENALVSHDLFEGIQGRTALASDIVLFEGYPSNYATYALRMHRWVRGDWQLLPWLFPKVPSGRGGFRRNDLATIDRWKIADNLRRSMTSPLVLALLVLGFVWLPGNAALWALGALAMLLAPILPALARGRRALLEGLGRCALAITFLAFESSVVVDAIVRTLVRRTLTRKHLLRWTSAAHAALGIEERSPRAVFWQLMSASPLLATAIGGLVVWLHPRAFIFAAPLLELWFFAPEVARWLSKDRLSHAEHITESEHRTLRRLARRTWRFFDVFVGPDDQWLPVDNYQEQPHEQTAHRTSPTNIGLMLIATLSAYDFGYIGPGELSLRVRRAFDSITRMPHYRGHLFNWYDTKNLQPLLPHYVSTVDSGNLAGCLLALKHGCTEVAIAPVVRAEAWDGLRDSVDLLQEVVESAPLGVVDSLRAVIARMQQATLHAHDNLHDAYATLRMLSDETSAEIDRELLAFLETGALRHEPDLLHALRASISRLHQKLQQMRRELDALLPWLQLKAEAAAHELDVPTELRLDEIPAVSKRMRSHLETKELERRQRGEPSPELEASAQRLDEAFRSAELNATALIAELRALSTRADEEVRGMDFELLYDRERKLFHIGYNATIDQVDAHYYDLLASEARLASYLAIVKRDAPESHWFALGRPMTRVAGAPALLSWGGTMFEYLMPGLLMKSQEGTLLARTSSLAVDGQIAHAKQNAEPWGISESAYARLDADQTYQYRSFGVPGLGFKRGLEEDRVVTPYASILAVSIRPRAVLDNVVALEAMGMLGTYGLFEALDLTPDRAAEHPPIGRPFAVVRSYMAHHQGMLLVALGNFLNRRSMVERFHSDALIETGEMLLNEHAPGTAPTEWPLADGGKIAGEVEPEALPPAPGPWSSDHGGPHAFVLSNGRLSSWLTASGGGGLRWQGLALTRYEPDATRDSDGIWFYLRDEESRRVWLATSAEGRTTYAMHKTEFHLRKEGISVHVDVAVAAADDVEVRQITLHNETNRPRRLTVTSAGRPVLFDAKEAPAHPAFSSMFIESEHVAELDALVFARRPQTAAESPAVLVHRLVREGRAVTFAGYESDRAAFFGRGAGSGAPQSLATEALGLRGRVGAVLDPIMSLMARVDLAPKGSVTLAFVTTIGRSRAAALELARKYGSMHAVRWTFRDAEQESPRRLQRTQIEPALLPGVQRLFSALLFVDPTLRASSDARAAEPPSQRRLWGRQISGDNPIVLVRVNDPGALLLGETLAAQRFLRSCGVRLDLVLVDEQASGYASEGSGTLRSVLAQHEVDEWLDRRGGIFVIAADQVSQSDLRHLEACARIVLDTRDGSLITRLGRVVDSPPRLPPLEATLVDEPREQPRPRPNLRFDNGIGGFSEDGREYVLEVIPGKPTPAPWCNVLANPDFGCVVSESSLGATWSENSGENRLTPWKNDPVLDTPSEVLYLRDEETAAVWSTTPLPAGRSGQTLVRHGAGYTTYERESHGLVQELTVFVPPDATLKVVRLRVKNTIGRHRRLTATYYAEWVLGSRREAQRPYIVSEFAQDHACLLATCHWNAEFGERVAFLASKDPAHGFTADRTEFLGRRGDYARPEALERWGLSGRVDLGADPCAALQVHIDLAPGEGTETHFIVGQSSNRDEALALVARFRGEAVVDAAWKDLHAFWDRVLGSVRVKTPEPSMDLMLNRWLLYQTLSSRVFGRTGFYQSSGAFGYRDQLQDVLALLHAAPSIARAHILEAAKHQFEEGDVLHWWHPPSGRGVRTRCSDDMAWLPYVTGEYVAATGDTAILEESVPFLHAEPLRPDEHDRYAEYQASASSASLFEHCRRALERAVTEGVHGLPLMGDGDWNDGMSRVGAEGRGESVWLGWFLCATMDRFAALSTSKNDGVEALKWRDRAQSLRAKISDVAWDGAWYLRAFHDDGSLVGSASSRECRIDSIAQSWAVLSQGKNGNPEPKTLAAVRAADEQLVRRADRLVLLFWPPFESTLHDPGYVRAYPPGVRENGGQYTHAATWLGFAHAALGDGERAERIFSLLNPALRARTAEDCARYRVEPYALAGDIYSCPPWVGRGGWTWYTGSAAWMWRLGVEGVLGLRKEGGHLCVDPCIPPSWKGFEAWVRLAEHDIHFVVENPDQVARGVASITLDGSKLESNRISLDPKAAGKHEVHVRLGSNARSVRNGPHGGVQPASSFALKV